MGALVGGVYAAGGLAEFTDYVRKLGRADVLRLTDVTLGAPGLIRLTRVVEELRRFVGDRAIEDLPIPYAAVATDIDALREVWFRHGPLLPAIRASISIPGVFTPVRLQDRILVDGGLLNPLPMGPVMDVDAEARVGVSLFGASPGFALRGPASESSDGAHLTDEPDPGWLDRLGESLRRTKAAPVDDLTHGTNLVAMSMRALDVMQARIELARTAMNAPDVIISVPIQTANVLEFHRAAELIDLGRSLAASAFDAARL